MSRETRESTGLGVRLLEGEPTPKFKSAGRETDEDVRTVLNSRLSNDHRFESLNEIVRTKNRTIDKLKQELGEVYEMYEIVYKELQKLKFQQRSAMARGKSPVGDRARSMEVRIRHEELILVETTPVKQTEKGAFDKYNHQREEGSLGTTIPIRHRSKCDSIDSNSLNLSSIKPQANQNDSVYKPLETSPQFAKSISYGSGGFNAIKPLLKFLRGRYSDVMDDSQYLPNLRYDMERLDRNSSFFGVLYRAALELTPEKEAASLSPEPKEMWRWLKWFFKQYMQQREQISEQNRYHDKSLNVNESSVARELHLLVQMLDASDLETAKTNITEMRQNSQLCRQFSHKISAIFGLKYSSPLEILQSLDRLHFTLEKERDIALVSN